MPTNRFQFSDDFVLNNGNVGINSSSPQEKLDVVGVVKGQDLKVTGVSSFTTYEGFLNSNQNIIENVSISNGSESGSLSGEIIVGTGITVSVSSGTTSSQGYIDSLKVYNTFTVPTGGTVDRPSKSTPGQLFYNKDFKTIEFWDGNVWRQVDNTTQSGRGVFGGGFVGPNYVYTMNYVNIASTGNAINFGSMQAVNYNYASCSSSDRGLFAGGGNYPSAAVTNTIEYITIASEGNSIDFGDLSSGGARVSAGGCSSSTRGVFAGGYGPSPFPNTNIIDYIQIQTLGNALDFGDLTTPTSGSGGCSSSTRGLFSGFLNPGGLIVSTINAITISSTGNAVTFGNLTSALFENSGLSNQTRGIFAGGRAQPGSTAVSNTIDYVTISTFGNASYFGDLTTRRSYLSSTSNSIRGLFGGGYTPTATNVIDFITISATGNAQDFGDLTSGRYGVSALSDSHGGLGGF
jgi:hypothetical protein